MDRRRIALLLAGVLAGVAAWTIAACSPSPDRATADPSAASPSATVPGASASAAAVRDLTSVSGTLEPGRYTKTGFLPSILFAIGDGWTAGSRTDGFFDIQRDQGSPDVIAVQFARVDGIAGKDGAIEPATTAEDAIAAIHENPGLTVVDESPSQLGGLEGLNVVVDNRSDGTAPVMRVQPGTLGFDPGRRLWISMFDTPNGVVAVMVGGSVAQWDRTLREAEPVLESVTIGAASD